MSAVQDLVKGRGNLVGAIVALSIAALLPLFMDPLSTITHNCILAGAYVVMALGLNIVVGFAGLLDLGYVAFYALGSYSVGWFASDHFALINHEKGIHVLAGQFASSLPGIHLNFLLIIVLAIAITGIAGMLIGLPTLRLRGDYIAIVTLAFGEIVYRFAVNGDQINLAKGYTLTGGRQAIAPIDAISLPGLKEFDSAISLRSYYWFVLVLVALVLFVNFRLRDSRLGRAWIAIREDEVAAASMGVPLVKTKLMAYATGAAFGGISGAFLGSYYTSVNAGQFQFGFSIFILAMIILGGLGSIWGVAFGAILLSFINTYFIPHVFNGVPHKLGLDFDLTILNFGIFGFLILIVMVLRPQGLFPERRRALELTEGIGAGDSTFEVRSP
ncbi:MAG: branched-chain amino acid transport system permease protein [Solirubrobacteraceae bacterium]|jgi:branched-chain amino acid transport system permease protein|nr:branched-chain amino acid transport system permease protein [Solirubrobacteraceae bacterium]